METSSPKKVSFRIPGVEESAALPPHSELIKIDGVTKFRISTSRAASASPATYVSDGDDVVEIEFEDGTRIWTSRDRFCRELLPTGERRRSADGILDLPMGLDREEAARGVVGTILFKTLSFLKIDVAGKVASEVASFVENKTIGDVDDGRGPGLYRCAITGDFSLSPWRDKGKSAADRPVLLFLHGTGSSTRGSFGELWGPDKVDFRKKLFAPYGDNILALEHRSLSESPVENAIQLVRELAKALPNKTQVHLVSHSRGGLVGELLCRVMVAGTREPFLADEIAVFSRGDTRKQRGDLAALNGLLKKSTFTVERFVRVACPAWGTSLASGRLDIYLSILFNLLRKVPVVSAVPGVGFAADIFTELIMLVAKERANPDVLPGIEAMIPGSPLITLLNRPDCQVNGELRVIAGDIEGETLQSALATVAVDPLFGKDNDLVVDTEAMFGGARRVGSAAASFHHGPQVSHFRYFKNDESAGRLLKALTRKSEETDGFEPFTPGEPDEAQPFYHRGAPDQPRPLVFLLPGVMGSHLSVGASRVWLDPAALAFGRVADLRIDATGVRADDLVWSQYQRLAEHLAVSHEVIPFPYDWRLSLESEAARFAGELDKALHRAGKTEQPVTILAHGMGGLLARAMITGQPDVWERLCRHPQGRLVMLGAPLGGSWAVPLLLTGRERLGKQLALLDMKHDSRELLDIFREYPGLLEMLPEPLFDVAVWEQVQAADGDRNWPLPAAEALEKARRVRDRIGKASLDPDHVLYVAGHAPATPLALTVEPDEDGLDRVVIQATPCGDGRVTWDSGIPAGIKSWYLPTAHGDLANHEESFPALADLLRKGFTERLEMVAPVTRGTSATFELPEERAALYTGFRGLASAAAGTLHRPARRPPIRRVKVSLCHGDLGFIDTAIMVGHYQGDSIVSAEAYLDRVLNGRLRESHRLGLYPGADDTAQIFLNPDRKPAGALVIGLGEVGSLTPGKLMNAVSRGVRDYVFALAESAPRDDQTSPRRSVSIATLLLGTNIGGVSLADSVMATLRGVADAAHSLHEATAGRLPFIEELIFVELYEDRATQAVHMLDRVRTEPEIIRSFLIDGDLRVTTIDGGRRRAFFAEDDDWWQRLLIKEEQSGRLVFNVLTDRARTDEYVQLSQRSIAEQFINEIITSGNARDLSVATTLFEMLIPNEIKEHAPDRRDLVLVLNEDAARYPWEMMMERPRQDGIVRPVKPLSIQAGMIRQLQLQEQQAPERVFMARGNRVLVVGNPKTSFVPLPGAEHEAIKVKALLADYGYETTAVIGAEKQGADVLKALYAADYRIIHLAGHGVYDFRETVNDFCRHCGATPIENRISGMVIGEGQFLTPAQMGQLRAVPHLVFINCCHLGKIEETGGKLPPNNPPRLAANLATQLIRMGVKAVVAAGWEVDDKAALLFAGAFYEQMLSGETFGEAVLVARKAVYDACPGVNTWGAYQCYGDHAFRLVDTGDENAGKQRMPRFVSTTEVVARLETFIQQVRTAEPGSNDDLLMKLAEIDERIPTEWRGNGKILALLGEAYGELEQFEKGVGYYKLALTDERATFPVKAAEQLWNLQARWAVTLAASGKAKEAKRLLDDSEKQLTALMTLLGKTGERVSLLAGIAAQRLSIAADPT